MHNRQNQVQLVLVDPRGRSFHDLEGLPHVLGDVASGRDLAQETLRWLHAELQRRLLERTTLPLLAVAVDDMDWLLQSGDHESGRIVARLCRMGRDAGIHVIACAPHAAVEMMGTEFLAAFPMRLVGALANAEQARVATGMNESGAERLEGGGDFVLVAKGEAIRFQAAWLGPEELALVKGRLRDGTGPVDWALVGRPRTPQRAREERYLVREQARRMPGVRGLLQRLTAAF
jgi:S-DNA-T family DNA segregation ATPase FtsK/SpoIIIE